MRFTGNKTGLQPVSRPVQTPADISNQIGNGQFIDKKLTFYRTAQLIKEVSLY